MQIEYEATFPNIDKDEVRDRLKKAGAKLVRPEFMQKRVAFNLPKGYEKKDRWVRVRDEKDKITLTYKQISGRKIEDQKEILLTVDNFDNACEFLDSVGCQRKSFQESKREIWKLDGVEIMIDEWPFLRPFVEIEGGSEQAVKTVSEKLGFDFKDALFCHVATLYEQQYSFSEEILCNEIPSITFDGENPILKFKKNT